MTNTAQHPQTSPFADDADDADDSMQRTPTLPEPPRFGGDDDAATKVQPVGDDAAAPPNQAAQPETIYRAQSAATPAETELTPEERKLAAERAARREAREQALAAPDVRTAPAAAPVVVTRRSTDQFLGALALFLLRLVVAAIMAVRGLEIVTNLPAAQAKFETTIIPMPQIMSIVAGVGALAVAVALVFGLLTRLAGAGVMLIAGGALAFVLWGPWSVFVPGQSGFVGEFELLLAVVGFLFLCVGGGGFSLDRSFRKSREKDRLLDQSA